MKRLLLFVFVWLWASCAFAQISHGGIGTTLQDNTGPTSVTTGTLSPGANHFLGIIIFESTATTTFVSSITDSSSLCAVSWITQATHANLLLSSSSWGVVEELYCYKTNANSGTLTFTFNAQLGSAATITIREYVGVQNTSDPYDSAPGGTAGQTSITITLAAPTSVNSLALLGGVIFQSTDGFTWTNATADLTLDAVSQSMQSADILTYSAGTTVTLATSHSGASIGVIGAVFKPAPGGGTPGCQNGIITRGAGCNPITLVSSQTWQFPVHQ
jgi:hypothetical protein